MEENMNKETVTETVETQEVVQETQLSKTEQLREISKEYGFDAFKPEEVKGKMEEFKTWQDSQKSELEKMQEQLDSFNNERSSWESEKTNYEVQLKASELDIAPDKLEDALKLADGDPSKLAKVLETYPSFKETQTDVKNQVKIGIQTKDNSDAPKNMDEVAKYMDKFKDTPYGQK